MTPQERTELVFRLAGEAKLTRIGIAAAGPVRRADYLDRWLAEGRAGEMGYLAHHRRLRADPRRLLPGAESVIVVADLYHQREPASDDRTSAAELRGRIAKYAWGKDYHRVLRRKLHRVADRMREAMAEPFESRVAVDTAPVLEREWAASAGIGWIGKNTMVLNQELGSFFYLGEIITTLELVASAPAVDHCGTCTRCLEACPTRALTAPYQMDARRCISYLTIEHRSEIDGELQPLMGDWVYGCDVCQDVCPFNRKAPQTTEPAYRPNDRDPLPPRPSLRVLQDLSNSEYEQQLAGSAMKRASLSMLKRNAAVVARNLEKSVKKQAVEPGSRGGENESPPDTASAEIHGF